MQSDSRKKLRLLSLVRVMLVLASDLRVCSSNKYGLVVVIRPFNTIVVEITSSGVAVKSCTISAAVRLSGWIAWLSGARQHVLDDMAVSWSWSRTARLLAEAGRGLSSKTTGTGPRGYLLELAVDRAANWLELSHDCGLELGRGCRPELCHGAAIWNWQRSCRLAPERGSDLVGAEPRLWARAGQWLPAGQLQLGGSREHGCSLESTA
ncbi:hypothetical protein L1887_08146 [Cichorium endivia]|nr:hypothetical protein L1887_08146 [Cichorium endivia]